MNERDLFIAALERTDPTEQDAFVVEACGDDGTLLQRVQRLLRRHRDAGSFLEESPVAPNDTVAPSGGAENSANVSRDAMELTPDPEAERPTMPAQPDPLSAPPAAFGRYPVRRPLGAGGYGAVYLGHDTQLDRPVAIKVLRGGPSHHQAQSKLTLQEARRLAQLRHPGIVAVHDVGVHEGQFYIVSDYLDGPNLGRWLRDHRPTWPEAARIAAAVADALAHAHARRIVHRDVKPANILLTPDRAPILVDFGLALGEDQAGGAVKGTVSGTPEYMSPEQAAGAAHRIDGRTDVYSLGVVLYEMLTGRVPFRSTDFLEMLRQLRDDEPQPPRQLVKDIPPELEKACLKALAKRQKDRYTTAADFADDLRRVLTMAPEGTDSRQLSVGTSADAPRAVPPAFTPVHAVTPPSSRRRAREAERRQVTVLVCGCDLFKSEAYLQGLDAEDQAKVLWAFQQACEEAARRFDGTVVQCDERGLLACFGYPVAYEDGARRAARTGLGLLEDLKKLDERLRRQHELELNAWVGLHTGPAVVEAKEDAVSLVGEARNVAVRLEDVAAAGQVLCSETTHRLVRGQFRCTGLGLRKLKGMAQTVEVFHVLGVGETRSPVEAAAPAGLTPLTGRDTEVSLLKDRWEQAKEGMGQVVLIIGEPGLGKSRLVYTLKEHVLAQMGSRVRGQESGDRSEESGVRSQESGVRSQESGVRGQGPAVGSSLTPDSSLLTPDGPIIEWRCSPHFQNTALYPAIDFYERALAVGREDPPQARFDRLVHRLEQYGLARPEIVPLWASLLSLPTTDRYPALSLSPVRQREETFRAMLEWLHARAARRPVLFVVEDLHWVDASTLEFLRQFLAEGLHDSILTLLTFRPEFQTPWPALAHQTTLALTRLTRRQVGDLIRKKVGSMLPEELIEQIYDRAGGVPLFVEEFARMVQESGASDPAGPGGVRVHALPTHEIPSTLQDLVMARLDRMEGERDLAQLAATLGREFSYDVLAAVASVDEPTLEAELARLVMVEILYPKGRAPRCNYIFKHALLEDALYNTLVKEKRQQFHRRIAEVLEVRFRQTVEVRPELLAHHFTEAGSSGKAIGYWLAAGLRSRERSANAEAIGHLTRGLALLGTLDESPERDAWELQLLNPLGTAYQSARGYSAPEVGPVFHRARTLCDRIGQPEQRFVVMWGAWAWNAVRGDFRRAAALAAEAVDFARRVDDPGMKMEALFQLGFTMFNRADFVGAREHCRQALAEYDDFERTKKWAAYTGQDAGATHRIYLALALWHLGYPDQALIVNREARQRARTLGQPYTLAEVANRTSWFYQHCRLGAESVAAAEEGSDIAAEQGFAYWHATAMVYKAAGIVLLGRPKESLPLLLKGLDAYRATSAEMALAYYLSILGDTYTQVRRFPDARKALDDGLAIAEKNDDRFQEAELYRLKGELHLAESNDQAAAEACFCTAIETARRQQSRAWELRATTSLARLRQRQGRRDEARAALAAVYGTYTEGFTMPDLVDATALLDSLG
jgi:predicted ATPase/class 3 adenylate cyclase